MWRSKYDMEPDAFAAEMERLWQQVKPLYDSLYTYTRRKLSEKYGNEVVPENGPIPAHLFGNMWSQDMDQHLSAARAGQRRPGYDLTEISNAQDRRQTDGSLRRSVLHLSWL